MSGSKVPSSNTRIQTGSLKPNMKELCKQYTDYKEILEAVLTTCHFDTKDPDLNTKMRSASGQIRNAWNAYSESQHNYIIRVAEDDQMQTIANLEE